MTHTLEKQKQLTDNLKKRSGVAEVQIKHNIFGEKLEYSGDFGERLIRTMINPFRNNRS